MSMVLRLEAPDWRIQAEQKMLPHLQSPGSLLPTGTGVSRNLAARSPQAEVRREQEDAAHKGRGMRSKLGKEFFFQPLFRLKRTSYRKRIRADTGKKQTHKASPHNLFLYGL